MNISHADMVTNLVKDPAAIRAALTNHSVDLIHAILGISGEAGELLDAVKKHVIYNKPLDLENVVEELGDIEFYLEQLRQRLGIPRESTLKANVAKLGRRYTGHQYSDSAAQQRADKV